MWRRPVKILRSAAAICLLKRLIFTGCCMISDGNAGVSSEKHLIDGYRYCMERDGIRRHRSAFPMRL